MMTRSVSFFWYAALRSSAPSTGTSASQGSCFWSVVLIALQQAGDREALAVAQLDRGVGAAHDQRRDRDRRRSWIDVGRIDLAHLRLDLQVDHAVAEHGRREGEADAEFLELDRDRAEVRRRPGSGTRRPRGSSRYRPRAPPGSARRGGARRRAPRAPAISTSACTPLPSMRPTTAPNGAAPEISAPVPTAAPTPAPPVEQILLHRPAS